MIQPGSSPLIDGIRGYLRTEHQAIQIKEAPQQYTIEMFNRFLHSGAVLLTLDAWKDVHPSLVTLPVDWEYTIPYGVLYSLKPSNSVLLFVKALQETAALNYLTNHR
jgi:hypothetical protein